MNLATTIALNAGGPGSGCRGPNCGRHAGGKGTDKTHIPKQATVSRKMLLEDHEPITWHHYTGGVASGEGDHADLPAKGKYVSRGYAEVDSRKKLLTIAHVQGEEPHRDVIDHLRKEYRIPANFKVRTEAYSDKAKPRFLKAGGPGSGPNAPCDNCGPKGGKKWKNMSDEERHEVAKHDPRQTSLLGPGHKAELAKPYNPPKGGSKAVSNDTAKDYKSSERRVKYNLEWHAQRMRWYVDQGMSEDDASKQAFKDLMEARSKKAQQKKMFSSSEADEPPVGAYSRKHMNKKADFFEPKPGEKGGVQAGGPGSGCRGPNCGRHPSAGTYQKATDTTPRGTPTRSPDFKPRVEYQRSFGTKWKRHGKNAYRKSYHSPSLGSTVSYIEHKNGKRAWVLEHNNGMEMHRAEGTPEQMKEHLRHRYDIQGTIVKRGSQHCVVSEKSGKNLGCSPSKGGAKKRLQQVEYFKHKKAIKGAVGEPDVPSGGSGTIEPLSTFHPPSLKKPQRVPTDDPREKDDRFLDVTKRKAAQKMRLNMLKRAAPGGLPPLFPVRTTGVEQHMGVYYPSVYSARKKVIQRPAKIIGAKVTHVPYSRRGSA